MSKWKTILSWDEDMIPEQPQVVDDVTRLKRAAQVADQLIGTRLSQDFPHRVEHYCLKELDHDNVYRYMSTEFVRLDNEDNVSDFGDVYEDYVMCELHGKAWTISWSELQDLIGEVTLEDFTEEEFAQLEKITHYT